MQSPRLAPWNWIWSMQLDWKSCSTSIEFWFGPIQIQNFLFGWLLELRFFLEQHWKNNFISRNIFGSKSSTFRVATHQFSREKINLRTTNLSRAFPTLVPTNVNPLEVRSKLDSLHQWKLKKQKQKQKQQICSEFGGVWMRRISFGVPLFMTSLFRDAREKRRMETRRDRRLQGCISRASRSSELFPLIS